MLVLLEALQQPDLDVLLLLAAVPAAVAPGTDPACAAGGPLHMAVAFESLTA
jgi:hypothetical protein